MPLRFVEPNDPTPIDVRADLSAEETAEVLAMARAKLTPEQMEKETHLLVELLKHPEKRQSLSQVLDELKDL